MGCEYEKVNSKPPICTHDCLGCVWNSTETEELINGFGKEYNTYIIGYCPDTDSFFATNQRMFFWESEEEFASEREAVDFFEANIQKFVILKNEILNNVIFGYTPIHYKVWLDNTAKWYCLENSIN